jgi:hypothetical protein
MSNESDKAFFGKVAFYCFVGMFVLAILAAIFGGLW